FMKRARICPIFRCLPKPRAWAPGTRFADVSRISPKIRRRHYCSITNGDLVSRRSPGCWASAPPRLAHAPAGEWQTCAPRSTVFRRLAHDESFTEAAGSADAGNRAGSPPRQTIAPTTPFGIADDSCRAPGFVVDSAGHRTSRRLRDAWPAADLGCF